MAKKLTRLRKLRLERFNHASEFADAYDLVDVTYRSHENGTRDLTINFAKIYAKCLSEALGRPISWQYLMDEASMEWPSAKAPKLAVRGE